MLKTCKYLCIVFVLKMYIYVCKKKHQNGPQNFPKNKRGLFGSPAIPSLLWKLDLRILSEFFLSIAGEAFNSLYICSTNTNDGGRAPSNIETAPLSSSEPARSPLSFERSTLILHQRIQKIWKFKIHKLPMFFPNLNQFPVHEQQYGPHGFFPTE